LLARTCVAVDAQCQADVFGKPVRKVLQCGLGDIHLGPTIDLSPHTLGRIDNDFDSPVVKRDGGLSVVKSHHFQRAAACVAHVDQDFRFLRITVETRCESDDAVFTGSHRDAAGECPTCHARRYRFRAIHAECHAVYAGRAQIQKCFREFARVGNGKEAAACGPGDRVHDLAARLVLAKHQRLDRNAFLRCLNRRVIGFVLVRHTVGEKHDDLRRTGPAVAFEFGQRRRNSGRDIGAAGSR